MGYRRQRSLRGYASRLLIQPASPTGETHDQLQKPRNARLGECHHRASFLDLIISFLLLKCKFPKNGAGFYGVSRKLPSSL